MAIDRDDLEPRFKFEVAELSEGRHAGKCYACGSCTGTCPVSQVIPEFDPRKILHMIILGLKNRLLSSNLIWYCTGCRNCTFVCPQNVQFSEVVKALRILALRDGYVNENALAEMGKLAVVNEKYCTGCLTCVRVCPFDAPYMENGSNLAHIEPVKCVACGICVSECPAMAIELKTSEDVRQFASCEFLLSREL